MVSSPLRSKGDRWSILKIIRDYSGDISAFVSFLHYGIRMKENFVLMKPNFISYLGTSPFHLQTTNVHIAKLCVKLLLLQVCWTILRCNWKPHLAHCNQQESTQAGGLLANCTPFLRVLIPCDFPFFKIAVLGLVKWGLEKYAMFLHVGDISMVSESLFKEALFLWCDDMQSNWNRVLRCTCISFFWMYERYSLRRKLQQLIWHPWILN